MKIFFNRLLAVIKRYLLAGFVAVLPFYLTVKVTLFVVQKVDRVISPLVPAEFLPSYYLPAIGFSDYIFSIFVSIFLMTVLGIIVRNYIGIKVMAIVIKLVDGIPIIRSIYFGVKKLIDTFVNKDSAAFKEVALVQFPRPGVWTIGFIASEVAPHYRPQAAGNDKTYLNIFVPTTPNPTSGLLLLVPADEVEKLDISVESAFKTIVSGGIIS